MIPKFQTTVAQVLERPIRTEEVNTMISYAKSMALRLSVADALKSIEDEAIEETFAQLKRKYPQFNTLHFKAYEKGKRDMKMVLRYSFQAMLLDSPQYLNDRLLYWLRTMIGSGGLTPGFVRDTYSFFREALKAKMPAAQYEFMKPVLDNVVDVLPDFPVPANPRV
ncbi:MAG: hypothetical protein P1V97_21360 [Planctomycetota bacterium]|nr:hypothetical protein [Planctomycetota bacterium]